MPTSVADDIATAREPQRAGFVASLVEHQVPIPLVNHGAPVANSAKSNQPCGIPVNTSRSCAAAAAEACWSPASLSALRSSSELPVSAETRPASVPRSGVRVMDTISSRHNHQFLRTVMPNRPITPPHAAAELKRWIRHAYHADSFWFHLLGVYSRVSSVANEHHNPYIVAPDLYNGRCRGCVR